MGLNTAETIQRKNKKVGGGVTLMYHFAASNWTAEMEKEQKPCLQASSASDTFQDHKEV